MKALLLLDALINLGLGALLLLFPRDLVQALGLPDADPAFYPSILGAVLIGIGIALLAERTQPSRALAGLGLGGAVAINVCGGLALAAWLLVGQLALPLRASVGLWSLVAVLLSLSSLEFYRARSSPPRDAA